MILYCLIVFVFFEIKTKIMMVYEQIQSYRISFELTKPNHSNPSLLVGTMMLI